MKRILGALGVVAVGLMLGAAPANATETPVEPYLVCPGPDFGYEFTQLMVPPDSKDATYESNVETRGVISVVKTDSDGVKTFYSFDRKEFYDKSCAPALEVQPALPPEPVTTETPAPAPLVEAPVAAPVVVEEVAEAPVSVPAEVIDYVDTPVAAPVPQLAETGLSKEGIMTLLVGLTVTFAGFAMLTVAKAKTRQK